MQSNEEYHIKCAFCGNFNDFDEKELYTYINEKKTLKEKFCLECGENLILSCPICEKTFNLESSLLKSNNIAIFDTFWDAIPSDTDAIIIQLKTILENYISCCNFLTIEIFRLSQKEFINKIPEIQQILEEFEKLFLKIDKITLLKHTEKTQIKIRKEIRDLIDESMSILESIEPNSKAINEKKEKQLRKNIPFKEIIRNFSDFIEEIKKARNEEIFQKEALNPGYAKIFKFLKFDPNFYRVNCPICNNIIYSIQRNLYGLNVENQKLFFIRELPTFEGTTNDKISTHFELKLLIEINIQKETQHILNGEISFLLNDEEEQTIGRDFLRNIDYKEDISELILYDEDDPLARISNRQAIFKKKNNKLFIQVMKFDDKRVGTYFNSLENNIRLMDNEETELKRNDIIIIPLTSEKNNLNILSIKIEQIK